MYVISVRVKEVHAAARRVLDVKTRYVYQRKRRTAIG